MLRPKDYRMQFAHSTPNNHLFVTSSSNRISQQSSAIIDEIETSVLLSDDNIALQISKPDKKEVGYKVKAIVNQPKQQDHSKSVKYGSSVDLNLKNNLIKQLAASLLELNNLQLQHEHLETQWKSKSPVAINSDHDVSITALFLFLKELF